MEQKELIRAPHSSVANMFPLRLPGHSAGRAGAAKKRERPGQSQRRRNLVCFNQPVNPWVCPAFRPLVPAADPKPRGKGLRADEDRADCCFSLTPGDKQLKIAQGALLRLQPGRRDCCSSQSSAAKGGRETKPGHGVRPLNVPPTREPQSFTVLLCRPPL